MLGAGGASIGVDEVIACLELVHVHVWKCWLEVVAILARLISTTV